MTVKELMKLLKEMPKEKHLFEVVVAKDAEGNGFSPLTEMTFEDYVPENSYSGELGSGKNNSVVLWPTN